MTQHPSRLLILNIGEVVLWNKQEYLITKIVDLDKVLGKNLDTGKHEVLDVKTLSPYIDEKPVHKDVVIDQVSDEDWQFAKSRLETIRPLLTRQLRGSNIGAQVAKESGISIATLYRWARDYKNTQQLSALLPTKKLGGKGKGRVSLEVEAIITDRIENYYLTSQKPTITHTVSEVQRLCLQAGLPLPHALTIRKRISWIEQRTQVSRREGRKAAIHIFEPNEGSPEAGWPLAMVQIDHTLLDVMVVSETTRKSINRGWITLAIDVFSRMIVGMYITMDAPSAMSAGMCISHAILPKEKWLNDIGVNDVAWPCWGVMGSIHMDNAREFRGDMLKVACNEYGIDIMLRPVKTPHFGGHIERLMGTLATELKHLKGATFSNSKQRGEYKSEEEAIMTLKELEQWLVLFIARYHNRIHRSLGTTPIERYQDGLLGRNGFPPRGLPARRLDEEKLRIDFMPFVERTIQPSGVLVDGIYYFADVLRPWVSAKEGSQGQLFRFRRDPRDISQLYFPDPITKNYYAIPYRDTSIPQMSLAELKGVRKTSASEGDKNPNTHKLLDLLNKQRELEDSSALKTKAARKKQQKRLDNTKATKHTKTLIPKVLATAEPAMPSSIAGYKPNPNDYFDED